MKPQAKAARFASLALLVYGMLCASGPELAARPVLRTEAAHAARQWLALDQRPLYASLSGDIRSMDGPTGAGGTPLFYVIHLQPHGYLVVSGDDRYEPVVAFAAAGHCDLTHDNPLYSLLMAGDTPRIVASGGGKISGLSLSGDADCHWKWKRLRDGGQMGEYGLSPRRPQLSDVRVYPLVESHWSQGNACDGYCHNYYTPNHYVCGCGATALAQLLRYHQHPGTGIGMRGYTIAVDGEARQAFTRGGDGVGGPYDWQLMVNDPGCQTTPAQRQAIGALCYDAGVVIGTSYASDGSSSALGNMDNALRDVFSYGSAVAGGCGGIDIGLGLVDMVNAGLDAGFPVILNIRRPEGGHHVVADGYGYHDGTLYHHINMGWASSSDAWYHLPDFDPLAYYTVHYCLYNALPSGTGEIISGRVSDLAGLPLAGTTVTARGPAGAVHTVTTNQRGIYAFTGLAANTAYTLQVRDATCGFPQRVVSTLESLDMSPGSGNRSGVDFPFRAMEPILYVDGSAAGGGNDGSSWANAFVDLQDALWVASRSQGQVRQIWVAEGTYTPDRGTGLQTLSFQLLAGLALYGGFDGYDSRTYPGGEWDLEQRDAAVNLAILSGDVAGNDDGTPSTLEENSFHVINGSGVDETAILDGFVITAGHANGSRGREMDGAGMYIYKGSPTVRHCTFTANTADYGAGLYIVDDASPQIIDCTFRGNDANDMGGGIRSNGASPVIDGCRFENNSAAWGGALAQSGGVKADIVRCHFSANSCSQDGGAISISEADNVSITYCTFFDNNAGDDGGAVRNYKSDVLMQNCLFVGNTAADYGGAIYDGSGSASTASVKVMNCTLYGNHADDQGGGLANIGQSDLRVTSSILWSNQDRRGTTASSQVYFSGTPPTARYCCIQAYANHLSGHGNINANPRFVDPVARDFHLQSRAGHWRSGVADGANPGAPCSAGTWIRDPLTSPCIDLGDPSVGPGPEPSPNGSRINAGSYGGTCQASRSG